MGAGISLAAALGAPAAAQATDFTVTTTTDPAPGTCDLGDCSLREAVEMAQGNATDDRILFQAGLTGTIALGNDQGELFVDEPLEVLGPGAAALTVSADVGSRIFEIYSDPLDPPDPVTISGLTLTGGDLPGNGGAIRSYYADLTIRDSTISGGDVDARGGGVFSAFGTTTIDGSTISGNDAAFGGGVSSFSTTTTIDRSTISGNDAAFGGGVYSYQGTTTIESSTIAGNEATADGGGVFTFLSSNPILANTIVAGNAAPDGPDLFGAGGGEFDAAFSLIGSDADATVNETVAGSNITGQSPHLGVLAANGGPTETMALPPTSPAVNKGSSFGASSDQRGLPRPVAYPGVPFSTAVGADGADVGAFELQLPAPPPPPVSNNFTFGKLTLNKKRGIAILRVRVPVAGRVILLRTPRVRRAVRNPAGRRVVRLPVRARGKFRKRLLRTGRVRVRARVRFRPAGSVPRTKSRMVRLVKRKRS
jgi:CSLREA domain-containing protein